MLVSACVCVCVLVREREREVRAQACVCVCVCVCLSVQLADTEDGITTFFPALPHATSWQDAQGKLFPTMKELRVFGRQYQIPHVQIYALRISDQPPLFIELMPLQLGLFQSPFNKDIMYDAVLLCDIVERMSYNGYAMQKFHEETVAQYDAFSKCDTARPLSSKGKFVSLAQFCRDVHGFIAAQVSCQIPALSPKQASLCALHAAV